MISFKIDWFDLLAVQGTFKSLLQHYSSKASVLQHSAFFMVQLSHLYMTTGKTIALSLQTFVSKVMSLLFITLSRFIIAFPYVIACLLWGHNSTTAVSVCCFIFCSGRQAPLPTKPHGVELSTRGKWFSQRSQKAFTAESLPTLTQNYLPVTTWRADAWRVEGGGRCLLLHPPLLQLHWPLPAQKPAPGLPFFVLRRVKEAVN